jgi:hypothetical protein
VLDQRGRLLQAAVGFATCSMPSYDRALHALRSYLDSWAGIGRVAVGMHSRAYDLQLTQYDERGWRATFYVIGIEHSLTSDTASAWEPTPWRAVQVAARDALRKGRPRWLGRRFDPANMTCTDEKPAAAPVDHAAFVFSASAN